MARIRTIKPEFWTDEKLSVCSLTARLLFMGLISFADDEGRMEYSPARVRMQVFPCGTVPIKKLTEWIGELSECSLIRRYSVKGKDFLDIPGFVKHQKINRPTPSKHPPYMSDSVISHGVLSEPSVSPPAGMEGNGTGKEGKGDKSAASPPLPELEGLDKPTWERWHAYRAASKKPIKAPSVDAAMRELASYGADQSAVVEQAIASGYQGLWPLKSRGGGSGKTTWRPPPDEPDATHAA